MSAVKMRLSASNLKALESGQIGWDSEVSGFGGRVAKSGAVTMFLNYQVRGTGKYRRVTIGKLGELSVADARTRAAKMKLDIRTGVDPAQQAETQVVRAKRSDTLGAYVQNWLDRPQPKSNWSAATAKAYRNAMRRSLLDTPEANMPIGDVRRADLMRLVDAATDASASSGALFYSTLQSFLGWADDRGMTEVTLPRAGRVAPPPAARSRVMTDDEIAALWHAASKSAKPATVAASRLLFLTAQRTGALQQLEASWLRPDGILWPAAVMKSRREHWTPLTQWAKAEMSGAHLVTPRALSNRTTMWKADAGVDDDLRMHDVRRSLRTWAAAQGYGHEASEAALAHSVQKDALAKAYQQHDYRDEAEEVMLGWQRHVQEVVA